MNFRFGELICYRHDAPGPHDDPTIFVGPCAHSAHEGGGPLLIDLLAIPEGLIDHKDPTMWRLCTHLKPAWGAGGVTVYLDGRPIAVDDWRLDMGAHVATDTFMFTADDTTALIGDSVGVEIDGKQVGHFVVQSRRTTAGKSHIMAVSSVVLLRR